MRTIASCLFKRLLFGNTRKAPETALADYESPALTLELQEQTALMAFAGQEWSNEQAKQSETKSSEALGWRWVIADQGTTAVARPSPG